ncbi:hypothetical protein PM082_013687 [Marasmius tenuissimus]|nr:hypothetical protein PM082_013687 [Marasmius tenuissimus]
MKNVVFIDVYMAIFAEDSDPPSKPPHLFRASSSKSAFAYAGRSGPWTLHAMLQQVAAARVNGRSGLEWPIVTTQGKVSTDSENQGFLKTTRIVNMMLVIDSLFLLSHFRHPTPKIALKISVRLPVRTELQVSVKVTIDHRLSVDFRRRHAQRTLIAAYHSCETTFLAAVSSEVWTG